MTLLFREFNLKDIEKQCELFQDEGQNENFEYSVEPSRICIEIKNFTLIFEKDCCEFISKFRMSETGLNTFLQDLNQELDNQRSFSLSNIINFMKDHSFDLPITTLHDLDINIPVNLEIDNFKTPTPSVTNVELNFTNDDSKTDFIMLLIEYFKYRSTSLFKGLKHLNLKFEDGNLERCELEQQFERRYPDFFKYLRKYLEELSENPGGRISSLSLTPALELDSQIFSHILQSHQLRLIKERNAGDQECFVESSIDYSLYRLKLFDITLQPYDKVINYMELLTKASELSENIQTISTCFDKKFDRSILLFLQYEYSLNYHCLADVLSKIEDDEDKLAIIVNLAEVIRCFHEHNLGIGCINMETILIKDYKIPLLIDGGTYAFLMNLSLLNEELIFEIKQQDIYDFGLVILFLLLGKVDNEFVNILTIDHVLPNEFVEKYPLLAKIILNCTNSQINNRPNIVDILSELSSKQLNLHSKDINEICTFISTNEQLRKRLIENCFISSKEHVSKVEMENNQRYQIVWRYLDLLIEVFTNLSLISGFKFSLSSGFISAKDASEDIFRLNEQILFLSKNDNKILFHPLNSQLELLNQTNRRTFGFFQKSLNHVVTYVCSSMIPFDEYIIDCFQTLLMFVFSFKHIINTAKWYPKIVVICPSILPIITVLIIDERFRDRQTVYMLLKDFILKSFELNDANDSMEKLNEVLFSKELIDNKFLKKLQKVFANPNPNVEDLFVLLEKLLIISAKRQNMKYYQIILKIKEEFLQCFELLKVLKEQFNTSFKLKMNLEDDLIINSNYPNHFKFQMVITNSGGNRHNNKHKHKHHLKNIENIENYENK
eukprot:TRINITY_DN2341_c0_g1_i1.p1 TRINITY_DN2341_c0_g1~~TRINITY_DN2341_c0_g1_i1.p1  ORF type:complete len:835 (+),score=221.47 TRINITY_DN2341_c0_g1_i1:75-2579(+)